VPLLCHSAWISLAFILSIPPLCPLHTLCLPVISHKCLYSLLYIFCLTSVTCLSCLVAVPYSLPARYSFSYSPFLPFISFFSLFYFVLICLDSALTLPVSGGWYAAPGQYLPICWRYPPLGAHSSAATYNMVRHGWFVARRLLRINACNPFVAWCARLLTVHFACMDCSYLFSLSLHSMLFILCCCVTGVISVACVFLSSPSPSVVPSSLPASLSSYSTSTTATGLCTCYVAILLYGLGSVFSVHTLYPVLWILLHCSAIYALLPNMYLL